MELAITYTNKQHQIINTVIDSFPSVSVFWKSVASFIRLTAVPGRILAKSSENGSAAISVRRQDRTKNSLVAEVSDDTINLSASPFRERYLVNGDKAYVLSPIAEEDGTVTSFTAVYGPADAVLSGKGKTVKVPYPISEFWAKYYEKLEKGYKDRSRYLTLGAKNKADGNAAKELFESLLGDAKNALPLNTLAKNCRNIEKLSLTEGQIDKAWKVFRQLKRAKRARTFKMTYQSLVSLLPKNNLTAPEDITEAAIENKNDLFRQIDSTLSDMENIAACKSSFADRGVDVSLADDKEKEHVLSLLPNDIADRVEQVYKIHNAEKQASFDAYCKRRGITVTKELWHGSRNENWISIIKNGLRLHPNASITGKMFGDGIYFAPEAKKAYGYTSCQGTYWAQGSSNYGFMGLFTTAYGTPSHDDRKFYCSRAQNPQKILTRMGCDCLHAIAAQTSLRNDEIVFYHQDAMVLSYIVKIRS